MGIFSKVRLPLMVMPMILLMLLSCLSVLLFTTRNTTAQSSSGDVCRVVLSLDRSVSIGDSNLQNMKTQILNLFDSFAGRSVEFAFWTFSHEGNPASNFNYNVYSHDYERPGDIQGQGRFESALNTINLSGQTNYEQALSYNNAVPNNNAAIRDIRSQADVISIVSDGVPNYPGNQNPDDASPLPNLAEISAHNAVQQIQIDNPGVVIIGNTIGVSQRSMNYTVNGDKNNSTNVGPLDFTSIEEFLGDRIESACNVNTPDYSLKPIVQANDAVVSSGITPTFDYSVRNDTDDDTDGTSGWQIYDVIMNPEVAGNPLACGPSSYCDNKPDCPAILGLFGGRGSCQLSEDDNNTGNSANTGTFPGQPDVTELYRNRAATVDNIDDLQLGTRICRVLQLRTPTGSGSPQNRIYGACAVVGKAPLVQVHGGDLRVGRHFSDDDTTPDPNAGVYVSRFKITKEASVVPNGRTYGSWVEYGVLAPGPIKSMASLSGYAGAPNPSFGSGYDGVLSTNSCDLNVNKLTFANVVADQAHSAECGYLKESPGWIPDAVSSLTSRAPIDNSTAYPSPLQLDPSKQSGLYKNITAGINFEISQPASETIGKNKDIIVYVPNGTVTITSDIKYRDDPNDKYGNIADIPQLVIIAKDINIRHDVAHIDAWLIAAGNSSGGGKIDTCSSFTPPFSAGACNLQLRINGPVMARQLDLWRTKVDDSGCIITPSEDCQNVGAPGEIINLPGSSTLWAQDYGFNASRAQTTYTTELPPYY